MKKQITTSATTWIAIALMGSSLAGCSAVDRLSHIGATPEMSKIENPVLAKEYKPVSLPMPAPEITERTANSLWTTGRQTFFKDQRATNVGDIITVIIDIDDKAEVDNTSERSRSNSESAGLNSLLGYEQSLNKILPEAIDNTSLVDGSSTSSSSGSGSVDREEKIEVKVAALVTQILPNGNMVLQGRQEIRVNFEIRELQIAGIIRPEDITTDNTISYEKIAEARIAYGGRGHITDVQQPRYGQQLYDILFPF